MAASLKFAFALIICQCTGINFVFSALIHNNDNYHFVRCDNGESIQKLWPHPADNRLLFKCARDARSMFFIPKILECPEYSIFDVESQTCICDDPCESENHKFQICQEPTCQTNEEQQKLWPTEEINHFWKCLKSAGSWKAMKIQCDNGKIFNFVDQTCSSSKNWTNICEANENVESTTVDSREPPVFVDCNKPNCDLLNLQGQDMLKRYPSENDDEYWMCARFEEDVFVPFLRRCSHGKKFGFIEQKCVDAEEWNYRCEDKWL